MHKSRRAGETADESRRAGETADVSRRAGETADVSNNRRKISVDLEDDNSAFQVLQRVQNGTEQVYSSFEVRVALGLDA